MSYVRLIIHIWNWTRLEHNHDGSLLEPLFSCHCRRGRSIGVLKNNIFNKIIKQLFSCGKWVFLQYSLVFQSIDFSRWSVTGKAPHIMTHLPLCISLELKSHTIQLIHSESNFPYSAKNFILLLMLIWECHNILISTRLKIGTWLLFLPKEPCFLRSLILLTIL